MVLNINVNATTPPFEQLRDQLVARIRSGDLAPGTKLPSVRSLATELQLAPNTVAKTYRELETTGYVKTFGRNGTIVAPQLDDAEKHSRVLSLSREYAAAMSALGMDHEQTIAYIDQVWPRRP